MQAPPFEAEDDRNADDRGDAGVTSIDGSATAPELDAPKPKVEVAEQLYGAVAVSRSFTPSPSEKTSDKLVMPSGQVELGGEVVFVMSGRAPWDAGGEEGLQFTDLLLFRARARRAFSDWLEVFAGTELLAKQPVPTDEPIWQGGTAGARVPFAEHFAIEASGAGGPLLADRGFWWNTDARLLAKAKAGRYLRFAVDAGNSFVALEQSRARLGRASLDEVVTGGEAQLGERGGALWVRVDYSVPVAWSDALDPQVRVNLHTGGVFTLDEEGWDAYVQVSFIDRGDLDVPSTTLPILDGGFDQQQIVLGVVHRFGREEKAPKRAW
jgi:hypothetical protein